MASRYNDVASGRSAGKNDGLKSYMSPRTYRMDRRRAAADQTRSLLELQAPGHRLGDVVEVADGLWYVCGEMPDDASAAPDAANALVVQFDDRMYIVDSSVGTTMRASMERVVRAAGSVSTAALVNTHSHLDHICNNDVLQAADAAQRRHCISDVGMIRLDAAATFAERFSALERHIAPLRTYRSHRMLLRSASILKRVLSPLLGERRVWELLMKVQLRKFAPVNDAREGMRALERLPSTELRIGSRSWTGWKLGDDDLWLLEERAHTPDEILVYVPRHRLLHAADLTFALFPTWPDTDAAGVRRMLRRCLELVEDGAVEILTDGHHHRIYHRAMARELLTQLLGDHERFRAMLAEIISRHGPLTVDAIAERLDQDYGTDPTVRRYRALEYPHSPPRKPTTSGTTVRCRSNPRASAIRATATVACVSPDT